MQTFVVLKLNLSFLLPPCCEGTHAVWRQHCLLDFVCNLMWYSPYILCIMFNTCPQFVSNFWYMKEFAHNITVKQNIQDVKLLHINIKYNSWPGLVLRVFIGLAIMFRLYTYAHNIYSVVVLSKCSHVLWTQIKSECLDIIH